MKQSNLQTDCKLVLKQLFWYSEMANPIESHFKLRNINFRGRLFENTGAIQHNVTQHSSINMTLAITIWLVRLGFVIIKAYFLSVLLHVVVVMLSAEVLKYPLDR